MRGFLIPPKAEICKVEFIAKYLMFCISKMNVMFNMNHGTAILIAVDSYTLSLMGHRFEKITK